MSEPGRRLNCAGDELDLSRPQIMGILNVTPDSFSDGGLFLAKQQAVAHARQMVAEGAAIIDVGGESTRPGAQPVSVQQELDRVIPVIETLRAEVPVIISIDTSKPEVMRAALAAGAGMINDVYALRQAGALAAAAQSEAAVCLMHMQGEPRTMQHAPHYQDVVREVIDFLSERIAACEAAGIARERLVVDPGFGFGKSLEHNRTLFKHLDALKVLAAPLLIGVSRKSFIGTLLNAPVEQRIYGSITLAALGVCKGAKIVRVHDVAATRDALLMAEWQISDFEI